MSNELHYGCILKEGTPFKEVAGMELHRFVRGFSGEPTFWSGNPEPVLFETENIHRGRLTRSFQGVEPSMNWGYCGRGIRAEVLVQRSNPLP